MPMRMISGGKCAPLKLTDMISLPHEFALLVEGDHTANRSPTELRQNLLSSGWGECVSRISEKCGLFTDSERSRYAVFVVVVCAWVVVLRVK